MSTIITDRLVLRPPTGADVEAITTQINNFEICKNLAVVPYPYARSDAYSFLEWQAGFDEKSLCVAISEKHNTAHLIGVISYEYAAAKDNAALGYWLAQPYWNQGYMREAAQAVVDHAFAVTKLDVLVSCFHNDNPNSGKILRGVGFEESGPCMHFSKAQGIDVPATNMRLARERWHQTKKTA